jgi:hypothetical protein
MSSALLELIRELSERRSNPDRRREVLELLDAQIAVDSPPYIFFPGNETSFIQCSSIQAQFGQSYTITMWMSVDEDSPCSSAKAISVSELFSVRGSQQLNMRCVMGRSRDPSLPTQWSIFLDSTENKMQSGNIFLSANQHHFLSFRHSRADSTLSVFIDGHLSCEFDFAYPFSAPYPGNSECQWIFGRNFKGCMSSVALYGKPLSVEILKLIADLGPHMHSTECSVSFPQKSYVSCQEVLGTVLTKGPLAAKLCRTTPALVLSADHFLADSPLPAASAGNLGVDHIEFSSVRPGQKKPSLVGDCEIRNDKSAISSWCSIGGSAMALHLLWHFCDSHDSLVSDNKRCVHDVLKLICKLLRYSC